MSETLSAAGQAVAEFRAMVEGNDRASITWPTTVLDARVQFEANRGEGMVVYTVAMDLPLGTFIVMDRPEGHERAVSIVAGLLHHWL